MTAMEALEELVGSRGDIRKRDPRVFVRRKTLPANEVFVTMSEFAAIKNRLNVKRGVSVVGENERSGRRVRMEFGGIVIGFKKGNMEDGV